MLVSSKTGWTASTKSCVSYAGLLQSAQCMTHDESLIATNSTNAIANFEGSHAQRYRAVSETLGILYTRHGSAALERCLCASHSGLCVTSRHVLVQPLDHRQLCLSVQVMSVAAVRDA